jgi:hypothetical protein
MLAARAFLYVPLQFSSGVSWPNDFHVGTMKPKRFGTLIGVLIALAAPLRAQRSDDLVARHRVAYDAIERGLPGFRHAEASMDTLGLDRQSTEGGTLQAYCQGDTVRLLVADFGGETGDATERFYFDNDSLLFVFAESRRGIPNGRDPYPKRTIVDQERFYFSADRLVRWLGNRNVRQSVTSSEALDRAAELLNEVRSFKAVMPACHPKYAPPAGFVWHLDAAS